jgi:hypothetical protein
MDKREQAARKLILRDFGGHENTRVSFVRPPVLPRPFIAQRGFARVKTSLSAKNIQKKLSKPYSKHRSDQPGPLSRFLQHQ